MRIYMSRCLGISYEIKTLQERVKQNDEDFTISAGHLAISTLALGDIHLESHADKVDKDTLLEIALAWWGSPK